MPINSVFSEKSLLSGNQTVPILDLGMHGWADTFYPAGMAEEASQAVNLDLRLDLETGYVQLGHLTFSENRYSEFDYSYTSSNSKVAREHWNNFANFANTILANMPSKVLEIGSNDGFLLSILKEFGHEVLGVDASPYMSTLAIDLGIPTICGIFPSEETLVVSTSKYDLIIANNVLNHSNNPVEFVSAISNSLTDRGKFILEVPYWKETVTSLHFDQIYHEHISYFTVKSLVTLLGLANLSIINIELVEYHGGSLRVVTSKAQPNSTLIEKYILEETSEGLFSLDRYSQYKKEINSKKIQFMDKVETLLNEGKTIVGIGAAAKANTLLTYYGFSPEKMKFIAEASQHKIGKVTPVTMIPRLPDKMLAGISDCVGILLAWNIGDHLKSKLLKINPEMEFLYL